METRDSSLEKEQRECDMNEAEHKRANLVPGSYHSRHPCFVGYQWRKLDCLSIFTGVFIPEIPQCGGAFI